MKDKIQARINELLIEVRALDKSRYDREIEKQKALLDNLFIERNNIGAEVDTLQKEIDFLEKMFVKYKELEVEEEVE